MNNQPQQDEEKQGLGCLAGPSQTNCLVKGRAGRWANRIWHFKGQLVSGWGEPAYRLPQFGLS